MVLLCRQPFYVARFQVCQIINQFTDSDEYYATERSLNPTLHIFKVLFFNYNGLN
jgi:hypothetical protein